MRGEMVIYDTILATYSRTMRHQSDRVKVGSRLAGCLARLGKEGGDASAGTTRNGLLLLLALFFVRDPQVGLLGQDITTVDARDRDRLLKDLASVLPSD